jgi:membrane protein implicated in regulation of membrane protease activity
MLTELWSFAFAWYNVPFTVLLGLCVLLAASQLIGLGFDHDADGDLDTEADFEAHADVDGDADADGDVDAHADASADHDADAEHDAGLSPLAMLAFVGVGKAPLLVVLVLLCSTIGLTGWGLNGLVGGLGLWAHVVVLPLAALIGVLISARMARWLGRALPPVSSTASRAHELVGRLGTVISPQIDSRYGQVHLRAADGTLISIFAITDSPVPLRRGERVVLVGYDRPARRYWVSPAPAARPEPADEY